MELNWSNLKWAIVFGAGMGLLQIINVLTAYQTPPDWWTVVRFAVLPAVGTFIATVLQSCPKPDIKKVGQAAIIVFLALSFMGCASLRKQSLIISKEDLKNVKTCEQIGANLLKSWPCKSEFLYRSLGMRVSMLPAEAIQAWGHLDTLAAKPEKEWTSGDKCGALGDSVMMMSSVVLEAIKRYAPDVVDLLPVALGL